jgi:hypothetical protein
MNTLLPFLWGLLVLSAASSLEANEPLFQTSRISASSSAAERVIVADGSIYPTAKRLAGEEFKVFDLDLGEQALRATRDRPTKVLCLIHPDSACSPCRIWLERIQVQSPQSQVSTAVGQRSRRHTDPELATRLLEQEVCELLCQEYPELAWEFKQRLQQSARSEGERLLTGISP